MRPISRSVIEAQKKALVQAAKTFNQRVRNAVKSGRLSAESAPETVKAREIIATVADMPSGEAYLELRRRTLQLERARGEALTEKRTKAGAVTSKWEYQMFLENQRKVNRDRKRAAERQDRQIQGLDTGGSRAAWEKQVARQPLTYKPSEVKPDEFRSLSRALQRMSRPAEQKYFDSFVKAMKNRYSGAELTKIMKALEKAGAAGLDKAYRHGESEADLNTYPEALEGSPDKRNRALGVPAAPALDLPSAAGIVRMLNDYA